MKRTDRAGDAPRVFSDTLGWEAQQCAAIKRDCMLKGIPMGGSRLDRFPGQLAFWQLERNRRPEQ